jgi:hypothetical protein
MAKFRLTPLLFGVLLPAPALAYEYPTVDRVEFVLECMKNNGGEYHFLYKCSCVIDAVAKEMPYQAYVDASTVARYAGMGGERAGVFRDPEPMKEMAKNYRTLRAKAGKECGVEK